jgi:hypothetical protein
MNTKIIRLIAIATVTVLMVGTVFTASAKKRTSKVNSVTSIVQDIRNLENTPVTSRADCKTLKGKIEAVALPCFKKTMDKSAVTKVQKTKAVLSQLDEYAAQVLESSSNFDMADAGYIHKMSNSYFTFDTYDQMLNKASSSDERKAIESEIDAWVMLQNALQDYCTNASYLESYGGSMALLGVAGSGWTLSQIRLNDSGELLRIGTKATASKQSLGNIDIDMATSIIQNIGKNANSLKESVDDDFKKSEPEYYNTFARGITDAVKKVTEAMPKWLEARNKMLQYTANPKEAVEATKSLLEDIKKLTNNEL